MIVIAGALLGAILGAMTARKRKGNKLDMLQYAAGFGIAFALVGLIVTVIIHRMAV
jgi:hypothetical protein